MKIANEMKGVRIVRCRTIAEALARGRYHKQHIDIVSGLMGGAFRVDNFSHFDVLYEPLMKEYEGDNVYRRTCALASLGEDMSVSEFYRVLGREGYYPASISEGVAYLSSHMVDNVIHLGTFIRDERYQEQRLLTRGNGKVELIPFFGATKLKSYYHVVVVKEEKGYRKK